MGLHDRLTKSGNGGNGGPAEATIARVENVVRDAKPEGRSVDPYAELKTRIHHACIAKLGPELSRARATEDLTDRVLRVVTEQLALDQTPLTREERRQVVREITDDILGYGPLEPLLREDSVSEVMVNGPDRIYVERAGKIERSKSTFVDDAHLLRIIDKIVSQVGRRVDESSPMVDARLPDGSRVNAIIPPLSLRGPALTIRKFSRDPYTMDDLDHLRVGQREGGPLSRRLRARKAQLPHLGRHRYRKDDDPERALRLRARRRAHRHDRGRGRAPAPAGPRDPARVAPAEHRGPGRGRDPRARPERPAHAPGPDHRRRGPRRRDARHAPGDEHGPRGLADHDPRELAARRALPPRDARADRRRRAAAAGDPGADLERVRPDRPDPRASSTARAGSATSPRCSDGGRRDHAAGGLRREAAGRGHGRAGRDPPARPAQADGAEAALPRQARRNGVALPPSFFQQDSDDEVRATFQTASFGGFQ